MKKIIIILLYLLFFHNLHAEDNLKFYIEKALKNNIISFEEYKQIQKNVQ